MADADLNDVYHRLGGIEQSLKSIAEEQIRAANKRSEMYTSLDTIRVDVHDLKTRVGRIEPGFDEYQRMQMQVEGAGKLGKGLWWFGGWIIAAASAAVAFLQWIVGWPKPPG